MKLSQYLFEAFNNLYHAKLRSVLALAGVLVGTASVVAMTLGGELATHEALKQFKSLGTDLLAINLNVDPDDAKKLIGKAEHLTLQQALNIIQADAEILNAAPYTQLYHPVLYHGVALNTPILGVTDSFADILKIPVKSGRFISIFDKYAFYCVIGHQVYDEIKKLTTNNPIGQQLQIDKHLFVIVGVADHWNENSFVYANVENAVLIPILASTILTKYAAINNIILRLQPEAHINQVEKHTANYISQFIEDGQLSFRSAKEIIHKMEKQNNILTIFLGLIASISLLVGGIGVMNIMLVSVIERKKEIGIRRAVGANQSDIANLFLCEAVILSLTGGLLGVILGMLVTYSIAKFSQWEFALFIWPPLVGFFVSAAVGIFFGFYPAYCAAKLSPIEALRSE